MIGKEIRIERIMNRNTGRSVIVPMDHGFSMGQIEGLLDMTKVITDVSDGGANAIVLHKGLVRQFPHLKRLPGHFSYLYFNALKILHG